MAQVKDPVCGMMVDNNTAQLKSEVRDQTYYFCGRGCKTAFDKTPEKYLQPGNDEHRHPISV